MQASAYKAAPINPQAAMSLRNSPTWALAAVADAQRTFVLCPFDDPVPNGPLTYRQYVNPTLNNLRTDIFSLTMVYLNDDQHAGWIIEVAPIGSIQAQPRAILARRNSFRGVSTKTLRKNNNGIAVPTKTWLSSLPQPDVRLLLRGLIVYEVAGSAGVLIVNKPIDARI